MTDPTPWLDASGLFPQRYPENRNPTWPTKWKPRTDAEVARIEAHSECRQERHMTKASDEERDTLEAWLWSWYDRSAGPGEDWTWGELRDALLESDWLAAHDAKVLRDAADAWTQGAWADTPRRADRVADRMSASQFAGDWLRARAVSLSMDAGRES